MRLAFFLALLTATLGFASPAPEVEATDAVTPVPSFLDVPAALQARDDEEALSKRACNANGCRCLKGVPAGIYCGACIKTSTGQWVITKKRVLDHVYQCASNGDCCDYGYAKDCNTGSGRCAK
ncbi:hypothetical protein VTH82DRAFT_1598 [Thermothelomyces myriococcoides]